MRPGVVHVILARTEQEGLRVANALGLGHVVYPMTDADLSHAKAIGYLERHLLRVDGWELGPQPVHVVHEAHLHFTDSDETVPGYEQLRYGHEQAELAAAALARLRDARRHGSPFLDPQAAPAWSRTATLRERIRHDLHLCTTRRAGLECTYPPHTCERAR